MVDDQSHRRVVTITVPSLESPLRLDKYLADHPDLSLSRTKIQKLVESGLITVNNQSVPVKHPVSGGEHISVTIEAEAPSELVAEDIPLDILYEDDHVVVINKPAGLVTHPGPGNRAGTLANALVYHFQHLPDGGGSDRPGIVHRLDKNTSGLLVVARTDSAYNTLQKAIQDREVTRTYLAVIWGHMPEDTGTIDLQIGRSTRDRKKMAVVQSRGRAAETEYRLVERFRSYDLLEINLQTGRTHQIRVHFSHLGHPVFGDPEYGGRARMVRGMFAPERPLAKELLGLIDRQALHARHLAFTHPGTGDNMSFEAPLPADMDALIKKLRADGN
jgi:23S rRNA pseudouridine1911/1915/1917 synthase